MTVTTASAQAEDAVGALQISTTLTVDSSVCDSDFTTHGDEYHSDLVRTVVINYSNDDAVRAMRETTSAWFEIYKGLGHKMHSGTKQMPQLVP